MHPELNTQGIALSDLTQRTQLGQKNKLYLGGGNNNVRLPTAKKRIKLEQPNSVVPPPLPKFHIKLENDNNTFQFSKHTEDKKYVVVSGEQDNTPIRPQVTMKVEPAEIVPEQPPVFQTIPKRP